jgi:flagellar biosynthesis component FlhA
MAEAVTGFMIVVGGIAALFFVALTLLLAMLLFAEWQHRRKIKRAAKHAADTDVRHPTTAAIEQQIERAVTDLNLWTRLAVARGMRVDMAVVRTDPDAVHPMGRYYVQVKAGEAKG